MGDIYLKPYKPIPKRRTDLFTYVFHFILGCIFGTFVGGYTVIRNHRTSVQSFFIEGLWELPMQAYITFFTITLIFGIISALFGEKFWGLLFK